MHLSVYFLNKFLMHYGLAMENPAILFWWQTMNILDLLISLFLFIFYNLNRKKKQIIFTHFLVLQSAFLIFCSVLCELNKVIKIWNFWKTLLLWGFFMSWDRGGMFLCPPVWEILNFECLQIPKSLYMKLCYQIIKFGDDFLCSADFRSYVCGKKFWRTTV